MDSFLINHMKIDIDSTIQADKLVSQDNVNIGLIVKRGLHWRKTWKDDIDKKDTNIPKKRLHGSIIGYTNNDGVLVGKNSMSIYDTDKITEQSSVPGWAVVKWYNDKESIYPIGAENLYSLAIVE